ncbi:MAG: hypothetical protein IV093_15760 [Rubrivivax sp.]|nr:hypothetical protein [Rubrivivax sp.]
MNIVLSLDYEVYFGRRTGSVERSLIAPTQALLALAARYRVPLVFFVDVLYLQALQDAARAHAGPRKDLARIQRQLAACVHGGHELQLHLHPHWVDARWSDDGWQMDMRRYRLHDFARDQIHGLVQTGVDTLRCFTGRVSAFRAGGWCLQPFEALHDALLAAGIAIDSTVFAGGYQHGAGHDFDFRRAPPLSRWRFDRDPLVPAAQGRFLEVPIASHLVGPGFYWRLALARRLKQAHHRPLGDGSAMALGRQDLARKLLWPSTSVVSIDGLKADFLEAAYRRYRALGHADFVVIGHPKAVTPHSLQRLDDFLARHVDENFCGLNACVDGHSAVQVDRCRPAAGPLRWVA